MSGEACVLSGVLTTRSGEVICNPSRSVGFDILDAPREQSRVNPCWQRRCGMIQPPSARA